MGSTGARGEDEGRRALRPGSSACAFVRRSGERKGGGGRASRRWRSRVQEKVSSRRCVQRSTTGWAMMLQGGVVRDAARAQPLGRWRASAARAQPLGRAEVKLGWRPREGGVSEGTIHIVTASGDLQNQEIQDHGLSREDSTGKEDAAGIKLTEDSTLVKSQRMPLWTSASAESDIKASVQNLVNTANPPKNDDETVEIKGQKLIRTVGAPFKANEVPIFLEEKVISDRMGEKVKSFFKYFHQDLSCKSINYIEPQYRTSKVKEVRNNIVEDPAQACEINAEIEEEISSGVHGATQSSATTTINEIPRKPKPESATLAVDKELLVTPQGQCATAWDIDIILENIDELYADIEEPRNEIEDHMVEILNWEHNDLLPSDSRLEEDKNADVILREWLSGREGNIRSLISTLQYVLWPGSGWKKIPLVDLVEITSVRKAYSKALLSLHPDKLQQKGATTHQKYIAEKVFDVLQEAWSQFTSISPM